ncbi:hypothetical protein EGR_02033 [Echinococcus granulosus]|uniref:Uncharacterized protein n=1 Tax=Echinococcus granulosus TaxID=6210 RepID=W6V9E6_ECHGR|nr:hypothetical protein EGR_02033 [Echinococcus granulosus]EUB63229.1 hypothetical protein EGR_02033 [Echinococcus granulosus]
MYRLFGRDYATLNRFGPLQSIKKRGCLIKTTEFKVIACPNKQFNDWEKNLKISLFCNHRWTIVEAIFPHTFNMLPQKFMRMENTLICRANQKEPSLQEFENASSIRFMSCLFDMHMFLHCLPLYQESLNLVDCPNDSFLAAFEDSRYRNKLLFPLVLNLNRFFSVKVPTEVELEIQIDNVKQSDHVYSEDK